MRFAIVCDPPERVTGGIERHARSLSEELARRGHTTVGIAPAEVSKDSLRGFDWVVFEGVRRLVLLRHLRSMPRGQRLALFTHGSFLEETHPTEIRNAGGRSPSPTVRARAAYDRTLGRAVFGRFDRVFVLTESERDDIIPFLDLSPSRVHVNPLFISAEFQHAVGSPPLPSPAPTPYVCAVGRIEPRKNFARLLSAVAPLPVRLLLAGQDRGALAQLREFSTAAHLDERWRYLGRVSETEKVALLRGARCVVVSSFLEGVPTVALEARSLGRIVVLSGLAYGPEGPGVVRSPATVEGLRSAIGQSIRADDVPPSRPPGVEESTEAFLRDLQAPAS
ncbi:MAG: glycosyltransferase family 4 protein [Thermoplasmata archaeon]|nr:glycosyltransferase family 4 protein [Thermoplasmata archaeon]